MEIFSFEQEAREVVQLVLQSTQALLLPVLPAQAVLQVLELVVVQQVVEHWEVEQWEVEQWEQGASHDLLHRMDRMDEVFHQDLLVAVLLD